MRSQVSPQLGNTSPLKFSTTASEMPMSRVASSRPFGWRVFKLIASLPSLERRGAMVGIPGLAPLLVDLPPGCAFHPRCPYAFDRCRRERPELFDVGETRAACWLRVDGTRAAVQ